MTELLIFRSNLYYYISGEFLGLDLLFWFTVTLLIFLLIAVNSLTKNRIKKEAKVSGLAAGIIYGILQLYGLLCFIAANIAIKSGLKTAKNKKYKRFIEQEREKFIISFIITFLVVLALKTAMRLPLLWSLYLY